MIRYVTINSVRIERIHTSALVGQNKQIKHLMTQAPTLKQNKAVKTTFLENPRQCYRSDYVYSCHHACVL